MFSKKQNQKISKKTSFSPKNNQQNFKDSKNTDVLEPRTKQFSRTWSFEAKDFKMCPRGFYLCKRNVSVELKNTWKLKTKCILQNIVIRSFHRVTLHWEEFKRERTGPLKSLQARLLVPISAGPAPWGAFRGRAPLQMTACAPQVRTVLQRK